MRYIVRPRAYLTTPRNLKEVLGARYTITPNNLAARNRVCDLSRDFLLAYPDQATLAGKMPSEVYERIKSFSRSNKRDQRILLHQCGVSIPATSDRTGMVVGDDESSDRAGLASYVVRPFYHHSGLNYRVTESPDDYDPTQEYISRIFPKVREYRAIYSFGEMILLLRKKHENEIPVEQPWNHANGSYFQTINDVENCRLQETDFFRDMLEVPIIKYAHLIGVDVMISRFNTYAVTEFNFCPAITLEANLEKVKDHVLRQYA